jgi:hypothetical protein
MWIKGLSLRQFEMTFLSFNSSQGTFIILDSIVHNKSKRSRENKRHLSRKLISKFRPLQLLLISLLRTNLINSTFYRQSKQHLRLVQSIIKRKNGNFRSQLIHNWWVIIQRVIWEDEAYLLSIDELEGKFLINLMSRITLSFTLKKTLITTPSSQLPGQFRMGDFRLETKYIDQMMKKNKDKSMMIMCQRMKMKMSIKMKYTHIKLS